MHTLTGLKLADLSSNHSCGIQWVRNEVGHTVAAFWGDTLEEAQERAQAWIDSHDARWADCYSPPEHDKALGKLMEDVDAA